MEEETKQRLIRFSHNQVNLIDSILSLKTHGTLPEIRGKSKRISKEISLEFDKLRQVRSLTGIGVNT